jgi:hypothetical protein
MVAPRAAFALLLLAAPAHAEVTTFFHPDQVATPITSGTTSETFSSDGYRFTASRDKLFTGGVGLPDPIGRDLRVPWPDGIEAQAVTTGPVTSGGRLTISRLDGSRFDLTALTLKLLGNTFGAGANFEIMPRLNGEDAFQDPLFFNGTGFYGQAFSYNESSTPIHLGNTTPLKQFDSYTIGIYVDFALTGLTLVGDPIPEPASLSLLALGIFPLLHRRRSASRLT